ncbi:hypothetical protein TWF281_005430 [Arthrobotrys megalospora]
MDAEGGLDHGDTEHSPMDLTASPGGEATIDPESNNGTRSVDSGYFSRGDIANSPRSIPPQDRIIVTQDSTSRSLKSFSGKGFFLRPKQPELLLFRDAHIPDEFYSRFQDLVQLYDRPLKSKLKPKFMSWKVKVFGEDEDSKRPYIVILCDADSTKKLTKFFSKKEIKQQCEGTENLPPLPVLVITSTPVRLSAEMPDVFGREDLYLSNTNCGESIKIVYGGKAKMATLGGIVKVTVNGEIKLYGMTAGHIIEEDAVDDDGSIGDISEDSEADEESEDEDGSETDSVSTSASSLEIHVPTETSGCNFGWTKVGQVTKPVALAQDSESCNLDWSLVELVDQDKSKMNFVKDLGIQNHGSGPGFNGIEVIYLRKDGVVTDREVLYQPGTEPGSLRGRISTQPAFMHQSPSNKMARVYNMTWDSDWDKVTAGDCGSWVVDRLSCVLYGHIVAVDVFDEAYVVPFEDTGEQMAKYLGAQGVDLPSPKDFVSALTTKKAKPGYSSSITYPEKKTSAVKAPRNFSEAGPRPIGEKIPNAPLGLSSGVLFTDGTTGSTQLIAKGDVSNAPFGKPEASGSLTDLPATESTPIEMPLQRTQAGASVPPPSTRDYVSELAQYCQRFGLGPPFYERDRVAVPNMPNLHSQSAVYIEGILYGASLWREMHASQEDANQLASREALRNLALHHQRLLFEDTGSARVKPEKPTAVISDATMDKFRQKQLEVLLPKIMANSRERTEAMDTKAVTVKEPEELKEAKHKFCMSQEQDLPAAARLKQWFVAARKRHPAETIEALLNKQYDLEDEINDATYAQQSIQQEIKGLNETMSLALSEREAVLAERKKLEDEVAVLRLYLELTHLKLSKAREDARSSSPQWVALKDPKHSGIPVVWGL